MTWILPNNIQIVAFREGSHPRFRSLTFLLLTLVALPASRHGSPQDVPLPSKEASPTLFSTELGSSQAHLQLSGSWSTEVSGSLGYGLDTTGGGLFPASFPGMTEGFNFQQIPNLDLSLVLLDRYFFKTSFLDTSGSPKSSLPLGLNTFVLGYNGKPNEFLQSVRIGNSDVNMGDYDFLSFPDPSQSSIGASAKFSSGNATYEAMVRYEPASLHRQVFIGHNEVTEQRLAPGSYIDGRFFVLPDANVQNLTVYIEDTSGNLIGADGHRYRIAGPSDVVVSAAEGTVAFREPLVGRALVYYTKGGLDVGNTALGKGSIPTITANQQIDFGSGAADFNWGAVDNSIPGGNTFLQNRQVNIQGHSALLVYSPGEFSPFQADNSYSVGTTPTQTNTSVSATLVPNGTDGVSTTTSGDGSQGAGAFLSLPNGQGLRVTTDWNDQTFTVLGLTNNSGTQTAVDPRSLSARFPFANLPGIYTSGPGRQPQDTSEQILLRTSTPITQYELDTNIIQGSVRITRNGRSDTSYNLDYSSGLLTFGFPVADSDVIVVSYRTSDSTKPGGDLLFGLGAEFDLFPFLSLDIGTGLRWAVFGGSYSTEEGTNTGSAIFSAGLHYNRGKTTGFRADLEAGLSLSSPDTTGIFRLFGMEGAGMTVNMADGNMFPSSWPVKTEISAIGGTLPPSTGDFANSNRGALLYKDYHLYTATGAVLQQIGWTSVPAALSGYTGPYPIFDPSRGIIMVMDYQMTTTKDWVGAQIPLSAAPEDLSGAESITFQINSAASSSQVAAYLQIGSIGENLDGGNILQTSTSTSVKTFPFNDNGTVLTTAGGASPKTGGLYASEDTNGNGLLDLENSSLVVTSQIPAANIDAAGWSTVTVNLTPAQRAQLGHADAVRIVLVNTSGSDLDSTFQVASFSITKSPFNVAYGTNPNAPTVQEVSDPQAGSKQLENLFPEVKNTFHAAGQTQKVLQVKWSGATTNPAWTLTGYPNPVSAGVYKSLDFYLLVSSLTSPTSPSVEVNLTDQNSNGIKVSVPVSADDTWHKYSVDLATGAVTRDGTATGTTATIAAGVSRYTRMTVSSSGATGGDLYVDEIHLSHSLVQLSAGITFNGSYSKQGVVASIRGVPIISDLTIHEQAAATAPGFARGFESYPDGSSVSSYTRTQARLPMGRLGLQFGVQRAASQTTISAGHSLDVPVGPLTISDSYSQTVEGTQMTFDRSNQLNLSLGPAFTADVQDSATAIGSTLTQSFQATASSRPSGPFSLSLSSLLANQVDRFSPDSLQYFPNWADSFRLLVPLPQSDATRSGSLQVTSGLLFGSKSGPLSVTLNLEPSGSYQSALTTGRVQTSNGGLTLALPAVFPALSSGGLTITPSYTRQFSTTTGSLANQSFASDLATFGQALGNARYFYDSVPFGELFSSATLSEFQSATAGLQAASYQPGVSLSVARKSGSYLRDLFLPAQLLLSLSRDLERSADTVTDSLDWEVQYGTDALNLFGAAGVYPIFRFYKTDEIATNVDVKKTTDGTTSVLQNLITLYFNGNQQLQLDHRLDLSWTDIFQLSDKSTLSFSYRPRLHITLPYVPKQIQEGSYLQNTESATFTSSPDTLENSLQLNLNHETAIVLPEHGQISASAGLGVAESLISPGGRRILFGVQASIGAQLAF